MESVPQQVVIANRILVNKGVLDAFGHVSARDPQDPSKFLLSRNLAPALVQEEDLISYDIDGESGDPRRGYIERYIHSEIYRVRSDANAIVHSHAPTALPFTLSAEPLRAVTHMAAFLGTAVPVFEIRDFAGGDSDLLVKTRSLGASLAGVLGNGSAVLMRGHGFVVVGATVAQAVQYAVYLGVNAVIQHQAMLMGEYVPLTSGESEAAREANDGQTHRSWNFWRDEVFRD